MNDSQKNQDRCHSDTSVNTLLLLSEVPSEEGGFEVTAVTFLSLLVLCSSYISPTTTEMGDGRQNKMGKCLLHNWAEEVSVAPPGPVVSRLLLGKG